MTPKALITALALVLAGTGHAAWPGDATALIEQAGNTEDDRERQKILQTLASLSALSAAQKAEVVALAEFVREWNEGALKFYGARVRGKGARAIGEFDFGILPESALRPIAELYRGRMLAWTLIENSTVRTHPKDSRWFKDEAVRSFQRAADAFPRNRVARMYLGEPLPWPKSHSEVSAAPEWAALQREQLERLREIIHWWIDQRQRPDGQFGGGWGDDCEMWRWWSPVLLGFDDPKITTAQLKFSKAAVARPHLQGGFNTQVTDVEHAAEDTTDNLMPLILLEPGESRWQEWAVKLGGFMENVWTGANTRGQLQFKSFYFSATETAPQPERGFDVIANTSAMHPALLAWQRTGDPTLGQRFCRWLDTWIDATAREENGKPAGILPAAIRWPDGAVAGAEGRWWQPIKTGGYMHSYYLWPSVLTDMTDALILAHLQKGEARYLQPLRSMAAIRLKYLRNPPSAPPAPGSEAWCAEELAPRQNANSNVGGLAKSLARCKALTGTREFDELLALESGEFISRSDDKGEAELLTALRASAAALRVNFPGFTSEVRSTDRCMRFVQFLSQDYAFDEYRGVVQPKHELLYRMVTGDTNAPRLAQLAVRWRTPPLDIAARVTEANTERFAASLFHFGAEARSVTAELRLLKAGRYIARFATGKGTPSEFPFDVERNKIPQLPLELPPKVLCTLTISPTP